MIFLLNSWIWDLLEAMIRLISGVINLEVRRQIVGDPEHTTGGDYENKMKQ